MAEQKQHKPTLKKIRDAREKDGKVLKSQAITQLFPLLVFLVLAVALACWGASLVENKMLLESWLRAAIADPATAFSDAALVLVILIVLLFGGLALGGILIEGLQVGFECHMGIVAPRGSRFDLGAGLKRIPEGLKNFWLPGVRALAVLVAGGALLALCLGEVSSVFFLSPVAQREQYFSWVVTVFGGGLLGWAFGAALDYLVQHKKYFRELSMSPDEVRREFRESEGDPLIKSTRRSLHESLMMQNLPERVRKARVIVVEKAKSKRHGH